MQNHEEQLFNRTVVNAQQLHESWRHHTYDP